MLLNGGDDNGTREQSPEIEGRSAAEEKAIPGPSGEKESEGSGVAGGQGGQSQGSSPSGSGQGQGSGQEEDEALAAKRERQRLLKREQRARKKQEAAVIPSDVLPQTPSAKKAEAKKPVKASNLTAEGIAHQYMGLHELAALFFGEEVRIDKASAVMVGEAAYDLIQEYNLEWIGKWGKWGALVSAIAIAEVPVYMRLRAKQQLQAARPMVQPVQQFQPAEAIPGVAMGAPQ